MIESIPDFRADHTTMVGKTMSIDATGASMLCARLGKRNPRIDYEDAASMQRKLEDYEDRIASLTNQLDAANRTIDALNESITREREARQDAEAKRVKAMDERDELAERILRMGAESAEYRAQLRVVQGSGLLQRLRGFNFDKLLGDGSGAK
jgi:septal ring factor EnvC (AmiA/AmiB activator)